MAGLAAMLSSCATKPVPESEGGPRYYYSGQGAETRSSPGPATAQPSETPWPRTVASGSTTLTIYEPQVDSWDGHQVTARNAVGIQNAGQREQTYGVVTLQAVTLVDKSARSVSLENIKLLNGDFPSARESNQDYMKIVRDNFPKALGGLSLDRLQVSLVVPPEQLKGSAQPLNNTPPKIIFSTTPAILVYIDGPPVYRSVGGTDLERIINTRLFLVRDKAGQNYLHVWNGYMTSPNLDGPWTVTDKAPEGIAAAEKEALAAPTPVDLLNESSGSSTNAPPSLSKNTAPKIYVATQPSELIIFDGEPNYSPIPGTHLVYVANTTGNVFRFLSDQQTYVLMSGRWYRGPSQDGPWQFVPASQLPSDFANIPDNSPKENVKANVPGTQQATEALLANCIPDSTKVPRTSQMQKPQIDGAPKLEPISGTPLYYVANSGTPIIKVDDQSWYACENGVWFGAASIDGPWAVADSVPAVIYTIPTSSPLHYLTYVHVYGSTPDAVYAGYTPGYLGTEVEDGVVVYGTGYYYPPWVGGVWWGYPVTWGWGWGPCWTPWWDWSFAFGFGWGCGWGYYGWCHPPGPWWGPYYQGHHGLVAWRGNATATTARSVYTQQSRTGVASRQVSRSDARAAYARSYNSRTGAMAAGQRAAVQNVYNHQQAYSGTSPSRSSTRTIGTRTGGTPRSGTTSESWRGGSSYRGSYGPNLSNRQSPGAVHGYSRGSPAYGGSGAVRGGGGPVHGSAGGGGGRSGGGSGGGGGGGHGGGGGGGHGGGSGGGRGGGYR